MRKLFVVWMAIFLFAGARAATAQAHPKPSPKSAATRVNVTGTWSTNLSGSPDVKLFQEGDLVWGKDHLDEDGVRGLWAGGRLMLVYTASVIDKTNPGCGERTVLILASKGTATRLEGTGFTIGSDHKREHYFTRSSPDPGSDFQYPYDEELKRCGQLFTWELQFDSDSDQLKGSDWPVLTATAQLMKNETGLKIKIAGHTDSTGDPTHNQELSLRRAEAVKKVLVDKLAIDASRVTTKGWGDEQPLVENSSEEGRAVNRRVEIVLVH